VLVSDSFGASPQDLQPAQTVGASPWDSRRLGYSATLQNAPRAPHENREFANIERNAVQHGDAAPQPEFRPHVTAKSADPENPGDPRDSRLHGNEEESLNGSRRVLADHVEENVAILPELGFADPVDGAHLG
jgi:hypothetical protein